MSNNYAKGGKLSISEIKRRTKDTAPYFFDKKSLQFFGQKMSDFRVYPQEDGKYFITAPMFMTDYRTGKKTETEYPTTRLYNPETDELESVPKDYKPQLEKGGVIDAFNLQFVKDFPKSNLKVQKVDNEINFEKGGNVDVGVAETIIKQLGGANRLKMFTGAKQFFALKNGVVFKIGNRKINYVKITLNPNDLYDVYFAKTRGMKMTNVKEYQDIYFDQLKNVFEEATGMYLSFQKGGKTDDVVVKQEVNSSNGNTYTLEEYQNLSNEDLLDTKPLALSVAKAKLFEYNEEAEDYRDEINEIESVDELADFVYENNLGSLENTYNASWWGGVRLYILVHNDGNKIDYDYPTMLFMAFHRGGDVRGNYEKYEAFDMQGYFYEEFPIFADIMTVTVEKDGKSLTAETEDMEGYTLYIRQSDFDEFEEDDSTNFDELGDNLGFEAYKYYEAGGTLPKTFGQAGLVGETGTMNEMDLFAMGGDLPQGVHQYYGQTYNPAYPTPHGYAKGGRVRYMLNGFEEDINYILDSTNAVEVARDGKLGDEEVVIYFETRDEKFAKGGNIPSLKVKSIRYFETNRGVGFEAKTNVKGLSILNDGDGGSTYLQGDYTNIKGRDVGRLMRIYNEDSLEKLIDNYEAKSGMMAKGGDVKELRQISKELAKSVKAHDRQSKELKKIASSLVEEGMMAKGGKTQGYNDKLDESLGNTKGKRSKKEQNYKDRRDESEAMEKKDGRRKYARVKTMDKNRRKRKTPMTLAKEIRKDGEKWIDAVKRASAMIKKK